MRGRFDSQGRPLTGGFGGRSGLNEGTPTPPQGPPSQAPTQAQTPAGFPTPGSSRPLPTQAPPPSAPPTPAPTPPPPVAPPAQPSAVPPTPLPKHYPKTKAKEKLEVGHALSDLEEMIVLLQDIRDLLALQIPQGVMVPQPITVPPGQITHVVFPTSLFYLAITNDGVGSIQLRFPDSAASAWYTLNGGEVVSFSYPTPVLIKIGFQVVPGVLTTPAVRILGSY